MMAHGGVFRKIWFCLCRTLITSYVKAAKFTVLTVSNRVLLCFFSVPRNCWMGTSAAYLLVLANSVLVMSVVIYAISPLLVLCSVS